MTLRPVVWLLVFVIGLVPVVAVAANGEIDAQMTPAEAEKILDKTRPRAEKGDASAQYNLGVLYDRGLGVDQDYDTARDWYEKAAEQRYGRAEHNLGIMYESGKGVPKNAVKAAEWFRRGADDGQAASQNNLGVLYMKGTGVPQNSGKAAFWTARAAAAGNGAAIENLPRIVEDLPKGRVNAKDVNVRDQPDSDARVVRQASSDSAVVILAREPEWTQVLFPKTYETGWIANFLLSNSMAPLNDTASADEDTGADKTTASNQSTSDEPVGEDDTAPATTKTEADDTSETTKPEEVQTASAEPEENATSTTTKQPEPSAKPAATEETNTASEDSPAAADRARIGADTVSLRAKPSRSGKVIGQLHRDDIVTVTTRKNSWARVRTQGGMEGWLGEYLLISP